MVLLKQNNKKIVFTNGCFDIVHFGHIKYLDKAKRLGDVLIVGLNSDASVKRLKGESRPVNSEFQRACMLAAFYFVDFVVIFDEDTPLELISFLKPDILVKGADYKDKLVVGADIVSRVELIDFEEGFSTSKIIEKIKDKNDKFSGKRMARTSKIVQASEILKGQIAKVGELLCECLKKVVKF